MFNAHRLTEDELKSTPATEAKSAASETTMTAGVTVVTEATEAAEAAAAMAVSTAPDENTGTQDPHETLVLGTNDQNQTPNHTPNRAKHDGGDVSNEIKHKQKFLPTMGEKCRDFLAGRCTRGLNSDSAMTNHHHRWLKM